MSTPTEVAGRYKLERRLGAGGMSTVFLATDAVLERGVAVKLLAEHLAEDEDFVARFRREALAAARLQHPNIVQVFDSGQDAESTRHYIVMEYVDGPSGAEMLREHRRLEVGLTVSMLRDACHGLEYAHRSGVVHRDIKPGNLLMTGDQILKLADFGIAKAAHQTRITQVGSVLGTAAYLSPEQAGGEEAGPESDIYSLGVCAYQFLTGRLPHEYGSLTELALKQQNEPVEPITEFRDDVPRELDLAIRTALQKDKNQRYTSALEMADALEAGLSGDLTDATSMLDRTGYLSDDVTDATGVLPRGNTEYIPPAQRRLGGPPTDVHPSAQYRQSAEATKPPRKQRNWGGIIAGVLALLLAAGAIYLAVGLGSDPEKIRANSVNDQANELIEYIRSHEE
ncbi:MAG: protein kinase [Thermoleophilaceae bacterium]